MSSAYLTNGFSGWYISIHLSNKTCRNIFAAPGLLHHPAVCRLTGQLNFDLFAMFLLLTIVLCTKAPIVPCNSSSLLSSKDHDQFCRKRFCCPDRLPNHVQTCCVALAPMPGGNVSPADSRRSCRWTMVPRSAPNVFWQPVVQYDQEWLEYRVSVPLRLSCRYRFLLRVVESNCRMLACSIACRDWRSGFYPAMQYNVVCKLLLTVVCRSPFLISCWQGRPVGSLDLRTFTQFSKSLPSFIQHSFPVRGWFTEHTHCLQPPQR